MMKFRYEEEFKSGSCAQNSNMRRRKKIMRRRINFSPSHNPFPNSLFAQKLYNFSKYLKKNCPEVAQLLFRFHPAGSSYGNFIVNIRLSTSLKFMKKFLKFILHHPASRFHPKIVLWTFEWFQEKPLRISYFELLKNYLPTFFINLIPPP